MKRCPACQRTYTDEAQIFCADDGTRLEMDAPADDALQKTVLNTMPPAPLHTSETPPAPTTFGSAMPPGNAPSPQSWPPQQQQQYNPAPPASWQPQQQPAPQPQQNWNYQQQPAPGAAYAQQYTQPGANKGLAMASMMIGVLSLLVALAILIMVVAG